MGSSLGSTVQKSKIIYNNLTICPKDTSLYMLAIVAPTLDLHPCPDTAPFLCSLFQLNSWLDSSTLLFLSSPESIPDGLPSQHSIESVDSSLMCQSQRGVLHPVTQPLCLAHSLYPLSIWSSWASSGSLAAPFPSLVLGSLPLFVLQHWLSPWISIYTCPLVDQNQFNGLTDNIRWYLIYFFSSDSLPNFECTYLCFFDNSLGGYLEVSQ
jgi:hypothetical protein